MKEKVSVPLCLWAVAIAGSIIICLIGNRKKNHVIVILGAALAIIVAVSMFVYHAVPVSTHEYRVVYSKDAVVVLVDDTDGSTKRYDIESIPHLEYEYAVGDYVTVVDNGVKPVFISPAGQVTPAQTTTEEPAE